VGFALASGVMLLIAVFLARPRLGGVSWRKLREHARYMLPVLGSQAVLNLLLQSDTNLLRAFAARAASSEGLPVEKADALVGAYAAAQLFGYLPYQVLVGVTFLLFPLLSGASARHEPSEVARLVRGGVRVAALVTGLVVSVTAGLSAPLLRLVFPPALAELAGTAMFGLCLGLGCFAMFGVFSSVLISLGRPWYAFIATTAAWLLSSGANSWVLLGQPFGAQLLVYTAVSSGVAILGATALSGYWVLQASNALMPLTSALRVVFSLALATGVARLLSPTSKPATLLAALLVSAAYFASLSLSRELKVSELQALGRALLGRRVLGTKR
jgi:stage V sporulation protein B